MDVEAVAELLPDAAREALSRRGVDVEDPEQLAWAAAVGAVTHLLRNSVWEGWHTEPGGLDGPDMMRDTAALTRQVREVLAAEDPPDWHRVAALLTAPHRLLPDGRTLSRYARSARALQQLTDHAVGVADVLTTMAARDPRLARLYVAMQTCRSSSEQWWGMPAWPRRVELFLAALPRGARLPEGLGGEDELRAVLLAGPDRMSRETASWCLGHGLDGSVAPLPIPVTAEWMPDR